MRGSVLSHAPALRGPITSSSSTSSSRSSITISIISATLSVQASSSSSAAAGVSHRDTHVEGVTDLYSELRAYLARNS
eukprot:1185304-Rhodomonas_salina.2